MDPDITVLRVSGRLELGRDSQRLEELVAWLVADGRRRLLMDLLQVDYIDSAGIGALAMAAGQVKQAGGKLALVVAEGRVKTVLHFAGLDSIMPLADSVEQAAGRLA